VRTVLTIILPVLLVAFSPLLPAPGSAFSPDLTAQEKREIVYKAELYTPPYLSWAQTFNGEQSREDAAVALAVGKEGNVWITGKVQSRYSGFNIMTIVYDPDGGTINDTICFSGSGLGDDIPRDIIFDRDSYCLVTGVTWKYGSGEDFLLLKYDYSGEIMWKWTYDGVIGGNDNPVAMAIDSSNNIIITGSSISRPEKGLDFCTIKLHQATQPLLWSSYFNGSGSGSDFAKSVTCDSENSVIVTGHTFAGFVHEYDITTIKYDSLGQFQWVRYYNGSANEGDYGVKVIADSEDNAVVCGYSRSGTSHRDYKIIKYDPDGTRLWIYTYNGPGFLQDYLSDMVLDGDDNIYVTGFSKGTGGDYDYATVKVAPDGNKLWVRRYESPGGQDDKAVAIALDDSANVFVTGTSFDPNEGSTDIVTIMYETDGTLRWIRPYGGPYRDEPVGLAYDPLEGLYIGGSTFQSTVNDTDYLTIKYLTE